MGDKPVMPLIIPMDGEGSYSCPFTGKKRWEMWWGQFGDRKNLRAVMGDRDDYTMGDGNPLNMNGDGRGYFVHHWIINKREY